MITKQDLQKIETLIKPLRTNIQELKTSQDKTGLVVEDVRIDQIGIRKDHMSMKRDLIAIRNDQFELTEQINKMTRDITHIRKDQNTIVNFFDKEYLGLRKRVEIVETYLKLSGQIN